MSAAPHQPHQDDTGFEAPIPAPRRRWHRRPVLALAATASVAVLLVGLVASGGAASDPRLLVVDEDGAVSLVDAATGETGYTVAGATPTPDRSTLLTTSPTEDGTELSTRDAASGQVTGRTSLPVPDLTVRTVSPRGGAVALLPGDPGPGLYDPQPRARTSLTVAYTDDRPARTYDLEGNIEPEIFSLTEDALFVLSFVPPEAPNGYLVQRLDLATAELTDTGAPQADLNRKMSGRARAQALHPEGTHLYTLYTQTDGPVPDPTGEEDRWAFIHVINLAEQTSFCIFLDRPVGTGEEAAIGFGIAPDGRWLYVADSSTSTLTRVDAINLTAEPPRHLEQLRPDDQAAAVTVADDGAVYVATSGTLLQVDPETLEPVEAWSFPLPIDGLAAYGQQLRIASGGSVTLLDLATGEEEGVIRAPAGGQLQLLGPPAGQATRFPVECAC